MIKFNLIFLFCNLSKLMFSDQMHCSHIINFIVFIVENYVNCFFLTYIIMINSVGCSVVNKKTNDIFSLFNLSDLRQKLLITLNFCPD